jgi:hypothetical protein
LFPPCGDEEVALRVESYERLENSAVSATDHVKIEVSEEEAAALRSALATMEKFENLVLSEFQAQRGYAANDRRYSDIFHETHFWFKDGYVMASIRHGSVG